MEYLTQRKRDKLEESFLLYDTVGDSKMDTSLLGEALRGLGLNPTEGDVKKIVKELDCVGSQRICFEEFIPIYQSMKVSRGGHNKKHTSDFIECFKVFDKELNGTISAGELQHLMTTLGECLSLDEVNLITQGLEGNDGRIDIEDFVHSVMHG